MRFLVRMIAPVLIAALSVSALAAVPNAHNLPIRVGERGVAVANPLVPQPPSRSCVVPLFTHTLFEPHGNPTAMSALPDSFRYTPPANCHGPWSKVVLDANFAVTAGRQYDRTASIWLDGVNLFFGTTAEPSAHRAPHWHIERDLTRYASLFRHSGQGQVVLNNWVDHVYTGVISGSAKLIFYPAIKGADMPTPADRVYGLDSDPLGAPVNVQTSHDALSRSFHFPRNIERAYLDVIAQSQATDEQWYMCIDNADLQPTREFSLGPPASGDPLEQCGNGNFREVEVSIDGQPAGRAPVYPWTYTGGVDPYLWRPTPDIQTLNFVPYRIDLTPFAALLDNGKSHTIAVRVIGAHHFFSLAANLLVYLDHGRKVLTGRLVQNTLAANRARLAPRVQRQWKPVPHGEIDGHVNTIQQGDYVIAGDLNTSSGLVRTRVQQQSAFSNRQLFLHPDAITYHQIIDMNIHVTDTVTTSHAGKISTQVRSLTYPQRVDVTKLMHPSGSFTATIGMQQGYVKRLNNTRNGHTVFWSKLHDAIASHDTAVFNAAGTGITGSSDQHGHQSYRFSDSLGSCYARRIQNRRGAVSAITSGNSCPNGINHLNWRSRPNAM